MNIKVQAGNYEKMGITKCGNDVIFTFQCPRETACAILLFDKVGKKLKARVTVPKEYCIGSVRSIRLLDFSTEEYDYCYEIDGKKQRDPYGVRVIGREIWADKKRDLESEVLLSGFPEEEFAWGEDKAPEIPAQEMIMYKLHVRGFSMERPGKKRGTFAALADSVEELKELGITSLEVMPVYEFEEWMEPEKINYWGYAPSDYFAVKASYAYTDKPECELKKLIQKLHNHKMEFIMEMHFENKINPNLIIEVLRFWLKEYHVDGFKLLGEKLPIEAVVKDPYLSRTKIFYEGFPYELIQKEKYDNLYVYNEEFLYPARKMLNHLGGDMTEFLGQMQKQQEIQHFVNYISNNNTFTLADVFSYNEKHNSANGEENLDGNDWNFSSNYGIEGRTRKAFVKRIREKQIRNALAVLYLAQGIPLLWSGDEAANSQEGNNNAYCQDNKIGWINWKKGREQERLREFVRQMIAFRKAHPILSMKEPFRRNDYKKLGYPDLSYHGAEAWISDIRGTTRSVGVMYTENYAQEETPKEADTFLYIGYNFYMGMQNFALPKLPKGKHWYLVMSTEEEEPFLSEPKKLEKNYYETFGQTICILQGR